MLSLIVAILFGLSITFFAFQNSILVPVTLGSFAITGTPLYLVVIVALLVGIMMAWFISALEGMSYFMSMRHKDGMIRDEKREIQTLQKRIHDLQIENAKLRSGKKDVVVGERHEHMREGEQEHKPSILNRLFPSSNRHYSKQI